MWRLGKQAFVGRRKYDSPKNDCVGGYILCCPFEKAESMFLPASGWLGSNCCQHVCRVLKCASYCPFFSLIVIFRINKHMVI